MDQNEYMKYSKLTDSIMYVGNNALLRMNVLLYRNTVKTNTREYFFREREYNSKDGYAAKVIERNIDCFLSLENLSRDDPAREYIMISGKDLEMMRIFLFPQLENFILKYNEIFELRGSKLYVNSEVGKTINIETVTNKKNLWFKPGIKKLYNDDLIPCLEIYLNSPNIITSVSFPNLYELMYVLRTIQLQVYASTMLAYYERPPEEIDPSIFNDHSKGFFTEEFKRRNNN